MHLGLSTTLVWDRGSRVRDCKFINSSIWETLAKYVRITHPQVTNHDSNFPNFPGSHLGYTKQLASESETSLWTFLHRLEGGLPWGGEHEEGFVRIVVVCVVCVCSGWRHIERHWHFVVEVLVVCDCDSTMVTMFLML